MMNYIWAPHDREEWLLADILEHSGENVTIVITESSALISLTGVLPPHANEITDPIDPSTLSPEDTVLVYKRSSLCEYDPTHMIDLDDLCLMNNLHEGPLIHILRRRWLNNQIYTYAGDILISINPYKQIPSLYDDPLAYYNLKDNDYLSGKAPHVYAVANRTLRQLTVPRVHDTFTNQSVIISGESGAGKTEASKYMINFLIQANDALKTSILSNHIKSIVLNSGIVFEAFGNAKTVQNDNSSRFGKYIKLQYTTDNELVSTTNETFLLEKSRLVTVGLDERNYHVFYYMVRGMELVNPQLKSDLKLLTVDDFKILTNGECTVINNEESDANEFVNLCNAISNIGCSSEDVLSLWGILAAILHLGNTVVTEPVPGSAELPKCGVEIPSSSIAHVAMLLGVEEFELRSVLTTQFIRVATRNSVKEKPLSVKDSRNSVLALIKRLYHGIFVWLLNTINDQRHTSQSGDRKDVKFIGILDICGFEILRSNSFEQLCINFTNERLQHQFNDSVFASEQELYRREGIHWSTISYTDNQSIIDLIAKKPYGLLNLLEEHCMMNRPPDDLAILGQYHQTHGDRPDKLYAKPRFSKDPCFILKHFAGYVTYQIEGFIAKNYDSLQEDLTHLLQESDNKLVARVMSLNVNAPTHHATANHAPQQESKRANKVASLSTISSSVRSQLDALINALKITEPHFVKVIKPNDDKLPDLFNTPIAMTQLRCSDIIEVVRIRRERFQIRMKFSEFYKRFKIFRQSSWKSPTECTEAEAKEYCKYILEKFVRDEGSYQFGQTLLFIRETGFSDVNANVDHYVAHCAINIQKNIRRFLAKNMIQDLLIIRRQLRLDEEAENKLKELVAAIDAQKAVVKVHKGIADEITSEINHILSDKGDISQRMAMEEEEKLSILSHEHSEEEERRKLHKTKDEEAEERLQELLRLVEEQKLLIQRQRIEEEERLKQQQLKEQQIEEEYKRKIAEELELQALKDAEAEEVNKKLQAELSVGAVEQSKLSELQNILDTERQKIQNKRDELLKQLEATRRRREKK